jgi:hypothetical protein
MKRNFWVLVFLFFIISLLGLVYIIYSHFYQTPGKINVIKYQKILVNQKSINDRVGGDKKTYKTVDVNGKVASWDSKSGNLILTINAFDYPFKISLPKTNLIIPDNPKSKNGFILRNSSSPDWETAFCAGDTVTLSLDTTEYLAVFAYNLGPRMCKK